MKGSKPGLTSTAVINLNNCREYTVEQEAQNDSLDPLYAIDISKVGRCTTRQRSEWTRPSFDRLVKKTSSRKRSGEETRGIVCQFEGEPHGSSPISGDQKDVSVLLLMVSILLLHTNRWC